MSLGKRLAGVAKDLAGLGMEQVELYRKRGRSRRCELEGGARTASQRAEEGWAVRAGGDRSSLFATSTTPPTSGAPWPEPDGRPLRLPDRGRPSAWSASAGFDEPLTGEKEAAALLDGIERGLDREVPGARLVSAWVEDGASESEIVNTLGVEAAWRARSAALHLEARAPEVGGVVGLDLVARSLRGFEAMGAARRLGDLLVLRRDGRPAERDRAEILLSPAVASRVLAGLAPLLVGAGARHRTPRFLDRQGRLGAEAVTVVDDGRLRGGLQAAPVDGEGVSTRETVLVEAGRWRQPLLAWWEVREPSERPSGCVGRPGWRDVPTPGPTHLYLRPDPSVRVADLVRGIGRGYYLLEVEGVGWVDLEADRFALPVCGFEVRDGGATAPLSGAWLHGPAGTFLHRVRAVARDLTFFPLAGLLGSPSLLVSGFGLEPEPPRRPVPVAPT